MRKTRHSRKSRSSGTTLVSIIIHHHPLAIHISPQASILLSVESSPLFLSLLIAMAVPTVRNGAAEVAENRTAQSLGAMESSPAVKKSVNNIGVDIIDIRREAAELNMKDEIMELLKPIQGPKELPTLLLYDERGLQIFEDVGFLMANGGTHLLTKSQITYLQEYYLTNAEIDVLERSANSIAEAIPSGSIAVELGSGLVTVSGLLPRLGTNRNQ